MTCYTVNEKGLFVMTITIIHGQQHKGSTYHITEILKERLTEGSETVVHEYFMPKDTPEYCVGCFRCILKGEENCYQSEKALKILDSMLMSDVIIFDSPTYCIEMTGQLKTLFDHYGYMWMPHRPRKEMFSKIGVAISTAAGSGARNVTKSMARQMFWWGVPRIYRLSFNVNASCWDDVPEKKRERIIKRTQETADSIKKKIGRAKPGFKTRLMFNVMRKIQQSNTWNMTDRDYWEKNGWLKKDRPWKKQGRQS